jgi:hypothetical protein
MTGDESAQILELISVAWPKQKLPRDTTSLYGAMIGDFGFQEAYEAIKGLICTSVFPPTIADIRRAVIEKRCDLPEPERAWLLVCLRYGPAQGKGDRSVVLNPVITAALDAAGVDPHRFHTTEHRHWLKQAFLDVYTIMRSDTLKWEDESSRSLGQLNGGDAGVGSRLALDAPSPTRLSLSAHAGNGGGGDEPDRI